MWARVLVIFGVVAAVVAFVANVTTIIPFLPGSTDPSTPPSAAESPNNSRASLSHLASEVELADLQVQVVFTKSRSEDALAAVKRLRGHGARVRIRERTAISEENDGGLFYDSHELRGPAMKVANMLSTLVELDVQFYPEIANPIRVLIYIGDRTKPEKAVESGAIGLRRSALTRTATQQVNEPVAEFLNSNELRTLLASTIEGSAIASGAIQRRLLSIR